jgi:hypothetical protein
MAATDPDGAEHLAELINEKGRKASTLADVARAIGATDPDRAAQLIAEAERLAQSIWNKDRKASALADVAEGDGSHRLGPHGTPRPVDH